MSEIHAERAGLASGLMAAAHELGGAFGVSIVSAIALATGSTGSAFANGYDKGALTGALIAMALALVALAAVPSFRPVASHQVSIH
jgi:hypothetical protein